MVCGDIGGMNSGPEEWDCMETVVATLDILSLPMYELRDAVSIGRDILIAVPSGLLGATLHFYME